VSGIPGSGCRFPAGAVAQKGAAGPIRGQMAEIGVVPPFRVSGSRCGGEHSMLKKLITGVLAGVFFGAVPALALDLPDSGSKNFSPTGETPTYFANESVPVSARTADTTAADWAAEEAAAPMPSMVRPAVSAHSASGRHGRHASAQRSASPGAGRSRVNSHSMRVANAGRSMRAASVQRSAPQIRVAVSRPAPTERMVRAASHGGMSKGATVSAAKTNGAKHGKSSARHAGLVAADLQGA
jgi:hypothetical protein